MPDEAEAEAPPTPREDMEKALEDKTKEELEQMAHRVARGLDQLLSHLQELQSEQQDLQQEGNTLRETITQLLKDTSKLNIGMDNIAEPEIVEGPLDFVGRFWEMVRPRDNVVQVNEHIGELKRPPSALEEDGNTSDSRSPALRQLSELKEAAAERLAGATAVFGEAAEATAAKLESVEALQSSAAKHFETLKEAAVERLEGATTAISEAAEPLRVRSDALRQQAASPVSGWFQGSNTAGDRTVGFGDMSAYFSGTATPLWQQAADQWRSLTSSFGGNKYDTGKADSDDPFDEATDETTTVPPSLEREPSMTKGSAESTPRSQASSDLAGASPAAQAAPAETNGEKSDNTNGTHENGGSLSSRKPSLGSAADCDPASVLIEASITIDDGSVQLARVGTRDRCKDVAARFVKEHSLKAWFEEPLSKFLKQAEEDAERFPVKVEGDLLEIRRQYISRS